MHQHDRRGFLGSEGRGSPLTIVGVVFLLATWFVVAEMGIVSKLLLPSPIRVIEAARDVGWDLLRHTLASLARIVGGLAIGIGLGVVIGVSMQYDRRIFLVLDGIVETARPVPAVAWIPFVILIFGFAEIGKILLVVLGTAFIIIVTTVEAIERVSAGVIQWGLVCGLQRKELFRRIIFPAALPEMRGGIRISLAMAVTLVIVAEFMGATTGLGYLLNVSRVTLTTPTIILTIIILGWLSWILDRFIRLAFAYLCSWDGRAKRATR